VNGYVSVGLGCLIVLLAAYLLGLRKERKISEEDDA
jgi:hypothetical protein